VTVSFRGRGTERNARLGPSAGNSEQTGYDEVDLLIGSRIDTWVRDLSEFVAIPSERGDPSAIQTSARWVARRLRHLGARVETIELPGAAPLVVGEIGGGPKTLISFQHYDVQPAGDPALWTTPPYEPTIRDGRVFGRGAADDKGAFMSRVWGIEAYLDAIGELPCNVRFLVEGEEESSSPNLATYLRNRPDLVRGDGALIEGGAMDMLGRPVIIGGMRGLMIIKLVARTIRYDAHSAHSMLLPNAATRLLKALASMFDDDGSPVLDGLSEGAISPSADHLRLLGAGPLDDLADMRVEYGIERFIGGVDGVDARRAEVFDVTLNVQGIWGGYQGDGYKTIVPAEAHARLDIRLVPDQEPADILRAIRTHLDERGFEEIEVEQQGSAGRAYWTDPDHPILDAAQRVSEAVFGRPARRLIAESGAGPMHLICSPGRLPMTSLGAGHDDCRAHAPDENFRLDNAADGARCMARFLDAFASLEGGTRAVRGRRAGDRQHLPRRLSEPTR
jgi:acetylornithine deacetylase/succinyl-diaminopimelate desuccinylase-like protein